MDINHLPEALYLQGEREAELAEIREEESLDDMHERVQFHLKVAKAAHV
jgi:hypothetical protein